MAIDAHASALNAKARYQRVRELFDAALNLDATAQIAFIEQQCVADSALASELTQLLELERALLGQ